MVSQQKHRTGPRGGSRIPVSEVSDSEDDSDEDVAAPANTTMSPKKTDLIRSRAQESNLPNYKLRHPEGSVLAQLPNRISKPFSSSQGSPRSKRYPTDTPSGDRLESETSVSKGDNDPNRDNESDVEDDSEKEGDSDSHEESRGSKELAKSQAKAAAFQAPLRELNPSVWRRELESRSTRPVTPSSAHCSQSSQGSDGFSKQRSSQYPCASQPVASESGASSKSDDNVQPVETLARRKRRLSASPAQDSKPSPRRFKYRPVESPPKETAFASLFRQSQSSQSSQPSQETRKRPSKPVSTTGCVYVLHDDDTGHVKIGISRSAKTRYASLRRRCRKPNLTLEWHTGESIPWGQLQRLEKIVHWDLAQFNRRYKCNCGATHTEWFDVEIREAKRTVEMWLRYQRMRVDVTTQDLERLRTGFPKEEGNTWLGVRTLNHVKRCEYWHWKLFGEMYDEAFCEE
ncbi:hypothetical protein M409DRAFT_58643 [Zasmidium cellare ATCC 36951]|uniref:Bacteriophage T5 Orf172 DNA-binding domain-containing protein n=1 Tax=Zasmidium cellare ATCC 36951 TaxID=1080233 RepID=A0A6A6C4B2_ZASCE|nr:uncharacterized protein M409DRAFT_58643 [Zasmidium cellare ATCC 36951]KAF2161861.1 hypothetical protein M409DRAFT_58643 [Zasmidium cellare ATCC 36951]